MVIKSLLDYKMFSCPVMMKSTHNSIHNSNNPDKNALTSRNMSFNPYHKVIDSRGILYSKSW